MNSWQDLGNDRWKLTIRSDDPNDGIPPSVYRGTKAEIAEMLAVSQGNANRRIAELRRNGNGHAATAPEPAPAEPRPLTPTERMQTVAELSNPATVDTAIRRVIESEMGPMEQERERRRREEAERIDRLQGEAAAQFANSTPEWLEIASEANKQVLVRFMQRRNMDFTNPDSYADAFEELMELNSFAQPQPALEGTTETPPEEDDGKPNAPAARPVPKAPARFSTGVTSRDVSGQPPRPTTRLKYSREQLDNMNRHEYRQLMMTDRAELERCEHYYATHPVRRPA